MEQDTSEQTTTQAIKLKKEKVIKGITCPSCGGALDLREGLKAFNDERISNKKPPIYKVKVYYNNSSVTI